MSQRFLIIGSGGMLGRAWLAECRARSIPVTGVDRPVIDLTRPETVREVVEPHWTHVINCAAWTDVDGAETQEDAATAVNGRGVGYLAERCKQTGSVLVHYSTDYVFDGQAAAPYAVTAARKPVNAYGRSKARGEEALEACGGRHLLARTSWLYAPWGKNFAATIAALAARQPVLRVVTDQRGRPTSAEHLARATLALLRRGALGTFHVTDGGECSWHEFAAEIVRLCGAACEVRPCTSDEFPRPARRPSYSVLDLSRTESMIGRLPDWRENLAPVVARLGAAEAAEAGRAGR